MSANNKQVTVTGKTIIWPLLLLHEFQICTLQKMYDVSGFIIFNFLISIMKNVMHQKDIKQTGYVPFREPA